VKILTVADEPSQYLWGPGVRQGLKDIDLILSCGDLDPQYLTFLATFTSAPILYVHGNHDGVYDKIPPEGCRCIDDKLVTCKGLRILGLGGSVRYNSESKYQYTQNQMKWRIMKQWIPLHVNKGVDIVLAHAAAAGYGDGSDYAHQGFEAFVDLLEKWEPSFFIHGHSHLNYNYKQKRLSYYKQTQIINAYERYVFEI